MCVCTQKGLEDGGHLADQTMVAPQERKCNLRKLLLFNYTSMSTGMAIHHFYNQKLFFIVKNRTT